MPRLSTIIRPSLNQESTTNAALSANLETADRYLARFRKQATPRFIAGRPDPGRGPTFDNLNPADGTSFRRVVRGRFAFSRPTDARTFPAGTAAGRTVVR
jgi:hypothetical protein